MYLERVRLQLAVTQVVAPLLPSLHILLHPHSYSRVVDSHPAVAVMNNLVVVEAAAGRLYQVVGQPQGGSLLGVQVLMAHSLESVVVMVTGTGKLRVAAGSQVVVEVAEIERHSSLVEALRKLTVMKRIEEVP